MSKKHVTLFAQGLVNRAGIERMTAALANLLADKYEVSIVLIEPCPQDKIPYHVNESVKIVSFNSKFSGLNLSNIKLLRKTLKELKTEVLITVATPLVRISAPAVAGLKIRNISWEHFNLYAGSKIGSCWKWLSTYMVERTVVLCEDDAVNFRKAKARNVTVISNFSSLGEENEPSECTEKTILAVGRHADQKGFDMLIKAWAKTEAKDWTLKIVGSGQLLEQNISLAKELGVYDRIIFQDATPDIVSEYRKASCFVLSSRYEGLVMVLIEARMMGLTCVSFDCPTGPREIIRNNVDGFLVPAEDIQALADKLTETLASSDLKKYGTLARQDAMQRYGLERAYEAWSEIINR